MKRFFVGLAASLAAKLLLGSVFAGLLLGWTEEKWGLLKDSPTLLVIVGAAIGACGVTALVFFLRTPPPGRLVPRYVLWLHNPLRSVSWDFSGLLAMSSARDSPVTVHGFQPSFSVRWGTISPVACYVHCPATNARVDLNFRVNSSSQAQLGSPSEFLPARAFESISKGSVLQCFGQIAPMDQDQFLQTFDGAELVFEHKGGRYTKRFSKGLLCVVIRNFWAFCNPPDMHSQQTVKMRE
ncbi:MAG TPA: hypothetical protein VIM12_03650 [Noviherbaspirillum sp.]|uniref:hypothetical protein n=1 Tax=Noviherbaspirillum sp. TaxID=1926288 RepID=UPI002F927825